MDPPGCEWTPLSRGSIELCTTVDLRRRGGVSGECLMRACTPALSLSVRRSWRGGPSSLEWMDPPPPPPPTGPQAVGYDLLTLNQGE